MYRVCGLFVAMALACFVSAQEPPKLLPDFTDAARDKKPGERVIPGHLQPIHVSAVRGMDWLQRANQPDGKFLPGFIPALAAKADGDPFVPQAEAAFALIRAARFQRDERALILGKQALLRLLQDTTTDTAQPTIRFTSAPDPFVNRLAACGSLLRALSELPNPPDDLRAQSRQLAEYLYSQVQPDGTFRLGADDPAMKQHLLVYCTGPALAGLSAYEAIGVPKVERARGAAASYSAVWRQQKSPHMIPDHTAANTESYLRTGDPVLAQIVFEMNDWLVAQQYPQDPRQPLWAGGFLPWVDGKQTNRPPDAVTAHYALSLVDACRVAKKAGDQQRFARYRQSLEAALVFLTTLQYTDARVQHYAEWFRPWIVGGFFTTHQDGNLRLANTAHATAAMTGYLRFVAEVGE